MDLTSAQDGDGVCNVATYMQMMQENAELHRANSLLQALAANNASQVPLQTELRVSPSFMVSCVTSKCVSYLVLFALVKVCEAKIHDLEAILNGQNVDLTLVEEKRHLQHLNVGLADKVANMQAKESKLLTRLQDAKDQSELLEFRVLELEEELEKVRESVGLLLRDNPTRVHSSSGSICASRAYETSTG